jgi:hypothetical protein
MLGSKESKLVPFSDSRGRRSCCALAIKGESQTMVAWSCILHGLSVLGLLPRIQLGKVSLNIGLKHIPLRIPAEDQEFHKPANSIFKASSSSKVCARVQHWHLLYVPCGVCLIKYCTRSRLGQWEKKSQKMDQPQVMKRNWSWGYQSIRTPGLLTMFSSFLFC